MPGKNKSKITSAVERQTMALLYETYEQQMFRIAKAILRNDWQAEDAVHEAFVRMVPYLSRCRDVYDDKTKILIVRVIKSAAIDIYRKNKKKGNCAIEQEEEWIVDAHNPIETYLASLSAGETLKCISEKLSSEEKKLIQLRCYYGMPVSDIGQMLHISEDSVYKRLSRIRSRVKKMMMEGAGENDKEKLG